MKYNHEELQKEKNERHQRYYEHCERLISGLEKPYPLLRSSKYKSPRVSSTILIKPNPDILKSAL